MSSYTWCVKVLELDVCSDESVGKAFKEITEADARLDVLVNNAGFSTFGTVEMLSLDQCKAQFETNLFGARRPCASRCTCWQMAAACCAPGVPGVSCMHLPGVLDSARCDPLPEGRAPVDACAAERQDRERVVSRRGLGAGK